MCVIWIAIKKLFSYFALAHIAQTDYSRLSDLEALEQFCCCFWIEPSRNSAVIYIISYNSSNKKYHAPILYVCKAREQNEKKINEVRICRYPRNVMSENSTFALNLKDCSYSV